MIETISPEHQRLKDAATVAAAANFRAPVRTLNPVKPDPALVRSIGLATNADAFRGSSPDLQSLLDALLTNFGNEHDLVEGDTRDFDTNAEIRENNDGSRESVDSLQNTASQGEDTVRLDREVEDQRTKFQDKPTVENTDTEQLQGAAENRLGEAETDVDQAESLSSRAQEASTRENAGTSDDEKRKRSAELFEQKAAAAESAARVHRVMVQKVLQKVETQLENERTKRQEQPALGQLENDPEFAARLREMHQLLRERR
jgi:hypothetical protein